MSELEGLAEGLSRGFIASTEMYTVAIQSIRRSRVTGGSEIDEILTGHRSQKPATKSPGQSKN